jgi:cytoskeletal protein CcmA (bactofilin family)
MFRSRKSSQPENQPVVMDASDAEKGRSDPEPEALRSLPRRPLPTPARAVAGGAVTFEIPRRGPDGALVPARADAAAAGRERTILVGRGVRFKGDVVACERLVVEGEVDLTVHECRSVQIGEGGHFRGTFDVMQADVSGEFDGEMTVRERLTVRATGRVRGHIRYRHLVVEAGGLVSGDVDEVQDVDATAPAARPPVDAPPPDPQTSA